MTHTVRLPKGWAAASLVEIALVNPTNPDWVPEDTDEVSFIPMADVEAGSGKLHAVETRQWGIVKKGYKRFQDGDVLFAKITPCMENGKVALAKGLARGVGAGSTEYHVLRPTEAVIDKLLTYYLLQESVRRDARAQMTGTAGQLRVPPSFLKTRSLGLPPLPEQHRIVEAIESYLTRLDDAVASLERVQRNLERYRSSILKSAVEGRLVPTEAELARKEGRSYEPASELLQRILAERKIRWIEDAAEKARAKGSAGALLEAKSKAEKKYKDPETPDTADLPKLPDGWCWASVNSIGGVKLGRQRSPKHHTGEHMRPYLRVANVFEDRIDTTDVMEMNFTPNEFKTYQLQPGDILLNEGQSLELVGRPAIYNGEVPGACFQNTLVRFRASGRVERRYALMVFLAYMHSGVFQKIARWTTNIAHLGASRFSALHFPLPPIREQKRIVLEVDTVLANILACKKNVNLGLIRATKLRQSILKWAFEGKLVEQDANDEPASALLERIKAERKASEQDKPKSRRKKGTDT